MAQNAQQGGQGGVVGSWVNTVYVNTPSGSVPLATEVLSVNSGGTFSDAISIAFNSENPSFTGSPLAVNFSDAYGTWHATSDPNQFAFTFKRLVFAGASTPMSIYGSFFSGENVGVATIEALGTLQNSAAGPTLKGRFTFQLYSYYLHGDALGGTGSGTFSATPITIQPLAP
jgi:hypothetical protein